MRIRFALGGLTILDNLKPDVFWSAFSALVAFATLFGAIVGGVISFRKADEWRRLQASLDKERKFYEVQARRVAPKSTMFPQESAIDNYLSSIENGLLAIDLLSKEQGEKSKEKIDGLIKQLRATHETLVDALKLFTTNEAKTFFSNFDLFNQDFGALYNKGTIPHNARTHCGDVVQIVGDLTLTLESATTVAPPEQIQKIIPIPCDRAV